MKRLFYLLLFVGGVSFAQVDRTTQQEDRQEQNDDQLQQQTPPQPQSDVERAVKNSDPQKVGNQNEREREDKVKKAVESSTGKEMKNPASNPPKPVAPRVMNPPPPAPATPNTP